MDNKWTIKKGFEGQVFLGADPCPCNGGKFITVQLGQMTQDQLAWWLRNDPATARRFVEGPDPDYKAPPPVDNSPGTPLPEAPAEEGEAKPEKKKTSRKKK